MRLIVGENRARFAPIALLKQVHSTAHAVMLFHVSVLILTTNIALAVKPRRGEAGVSRVVIEKRRRCMDNT